MRSNPQSRYGRVVVGVISAGASVSIPADLSAGRHLRVILGAAHGGGGLAFVVAALAIAVAAWPAAPRRARAPRCATSRIGP
jgi:hypothetical protein